MPRPPTRYAKSGDVSIAYQVVGDGPIDVVLALGFTTHLELQWESPPFSSFFERIASFSRLILFDKRGTGLSDPVAGAPTLPETNTAEPAVVSRKDALAMTPGKTTGKEGRKTTAVGWARA